jgi:hypothetical protein
VRTPGFRGLPNGLVGANPPALAELYGIDPRQVRRMIRDPRFPLAMEVASWDECDLAVPLRTWSGQLGTQPASAWAARSLYVAAVNSDHHDPDRTAAARAKRLGGVRFDHSCPAPGPAPLCTTAALTTLFTLPPGSFAQPSG